MPVRIVRIDGDEAEVRSGGRTTRISLALLRLEAVPVQEGDWVLTHTGIAIERIDEDQAEELLRGIDGKGT